jgi:hypothetical protein
MLRNYIRQLIIEVLSTPRLSPGQITTQKIIKGKGEKAKEVERTHLNTPFKLIFDPNNQEYIKDLGNQTFKIHRDSEKNIPIIFSWKLPGAMSYTDNNGDWHTLPKTIVFNNETYSTGRLAPLKALKNQHNMPHITIDPTMIDLVVEHTAKQAAIRLKSRISEEIDLIVVPQSSSPLAKNFAEKLADELGVKVIINTVVEKDFSNADFVIPPNRETIVTAKRDIQITKNKIIKAGDKIPYEIDHDDKIVYVYKIGNVELEKKLNPQDIEINVKETEGGTEATRDLVSFARQELRDKQARGEAGRGESAQIHNQTLKSIRRYLYNWMKLSDDAKIKLKKYVKQTNVIIVDDSHGEKATIIETAQELYYSNPKINIIAAVTMFDES